MHEDEEVNNHIFYRTVSKNKGVAAVHKYLLRYEDHYTIIGTDSMYDEKYGLMTTEKFSDSQVEPCEESRVKTWMDISPVAFDLLVSAIYQRM